MRKLVPQGSEPCVGELYCRGGIDKIGGAQAKIGVFLGENGGSI